MIPKKSIVSRLNLMLSGLVSVLVLGSVVFSAVLTGNSLKDQQSNTAKSFSEMLGAQLSRPISMGDLIRVEDIVYRTELPNGIAKIEVFVEGQRKAAVAAKGGLNGCNSTSKIQNSVSNTGRYSNWGSSKSPGHILIYAENCSIKQAQLKIAGTILLIGLVILVGLWAFVPWFVKTGLKPLTTAINKSTESDLLKGNAVIENSPEEIQPLMQSLQDGYRRATEIAILKDREEIVQQVAHDIRSPLTAVQLVSQSLEEAPEEKKKLLSSAVKRLNCILQDLDISQQNIRSAQSQTDDLFGLIHEIIAEKNVALENNESINIEFKSSLNNSSQVSISKDDLKRVLSNLINNSIEAITSHGRIYIELVRDRGFYKLTVHDNGRGISRSNIQKITEKGATFGKPQGKGLGLYHARKSLESVGGQFDILSEPGKGTSVFLWIPLS